MRGFRYNKILNTKNYLVMYIHILIYVHSAQKLLSFVLLIFSYRLRGDQGNATRQEKLSM